MLKSFYKKYADKLYSADKKKTAVKWYVRAGEFEKAGDIFNEMALYTDAADQYVKADKFDKAGDATQRSGNAKTAAEYFIKGGEYYKAASALAKTNYIKEAILIIEEHEGRESAAKLLEEIGEINQAAEIYTELKNYNKAIQLFKQNRNIEKMIMVYKERGNLGEAALECQQNNDLALAAVLYAMDSQYSVAAEIFLNLDQIDKSVEYFEKAGDFKSIAKIYTKAGKLDLAAEAAAKDIDIVGEAAKIYEHLMTLKKMEQRVSDYRIHYGEISSAGKALSLLADKALILANPDLKTRWRYLFSENGSPKKTVISDNASLIAVSFEGPLSSDSHFVFLFNDKKEILWQIKFSEPVKDIRFLPEEEGLILGWGNFICRYSLQGVEIWARELDFKVWSVDIAPAAKIILAGTIGGNIFQFDNDGNEVASTRVEERVHSLKFAKGEEYFIAGIGDKYILLFDLNCIQKWKVEINDRIRIMEFHYPVDHLVAVGNNDIYLINMHGKIIFSSHTDERILTIFNDKIRSKIYAAMEDKTLVQYDIIDCKQKSAECYCRAGNKAKAAQIYRNLGKYQEAYNLYKEIGDFENAGNTLTFLGDKTTAARHYEVAGKYKEAADIYFDIGELRAAAKCYGKAMMYKEAAQLYEQLKDYILAGDFYERTGEYKKAGALFGIINQVDRAISNYELFRKKFPEDSEVVLELGKYYKEMERYDDAIKMFQQITEVDNLRIDVLQKLGQCFQKKQIFDVALDRFFEAVGKDTKPSKANIDIFYDIGCTFEQKGDFEEAKKTFGKVMAIDYSYKDIQERLRTSESMVKVGSQQNIVNPTVIMKSPGEKDERSFNLHLRYKIISKLGEGGMGVVYLAKDTQLNRNVAWKVLPPNLTKDRERMLQESMLKEAQNAAQISHPNIISIYDIITTENECSIIMEYIEGITMRNILQKNSRIPQDHLIRYGIQITDALYAAHQKEVIHRDLKPENIMITKTSDEVKIVDFGLAKLGNDEHQLKEGCIVGTIPYMAPEQIMARDIGPHTDIYALGIMFFEALAGRTPFIGDNILVQHLQDSPPNIFEFCSELRGDFVDLIYDCIEKDPGKRPVNCLEIRDKLKGFIRSGK